MAHDLTGIEPMYLRGKLSVLGWQKLSEEARTFLSPNGKVFMVPDDLRSDGATLSVSWLIDELIGTKVIKSIDELRTSRVGIFDRTFFGCEIPGVPPGVMPFQMGPRFFQGIYDFVRDAALDEAKRIQSTMRRDKILSALNWGEMRASSYTIEVRISLDGSVTPLGRQVTGRLAGALLELKKAVADEQEVASVFSRHPLWTPGMCNSMINVLTKTKASEIKAGFETAPALAIKKQIPKIVTISNASAVAKEILTSAAARLVKLKEAQTVTVRGIPYSLTDQRVRGETSSPRVSIFWKRPKLAPITVLVELTDEQFRHIRSGLGDRVVEVTGLLEQRTTQWVLTPDTQPMLLDVQDLARWKPSPLDEAEENEPHRF